MSDPEGGLRPRSRRRARVWGGLVLAAAIVLLGVLMDPGARLDAWARARVREELGRSFGRPVSVASVHISSLAFSFEARDIIVGEAPPAIGRVLEIPSVSGTIVPSELARGRITLSELRIDRPKVFWVRSERGLDGPIPLARAPTGSRLPSPTSSLRLVLRKLEVTDGVSSFEDRLVPFWCTADAIALSWTGDENGDGTGQIISEHLRGGSGGETLGGRMEATMSLVAGTASGKARIDLGASFVAVDGSIRLGSKGAGPPEGTMMTSFRLVGGGEGSLPLSLLHLEDSLNGTLEGSGVVRFAGGRITADAHVRGVDLIYGDLGLDALDVKFRASPSAIEIEELDARAMGGRLRGSGRIEPKPNGEIRAKASVENISLHDFLLAVGLDSPLEGRSEGSGELSARIGDPSSIKASASLQVALPASPPPGDRVGVEGEGTVVLAGRRLVFSTPSAHAGATISAVRVEKLLGVEGPLALSLRGVTTSLADSAGLLDAFLIRQSDRPSVPWDSRLLEGHGTLEGDFIFQAGHTAKGEAHASLDAFAYDGIGAAHVEATGSADGDRFVLQSAHAEQNGGVLDIDGSWPERHTGESSRIGGHLEHWPVQDVLARIGAPPTAAARATGRIEYRTEDRGTGGETDLALTEILWMGASFPRGRFRAALKGPVLDVSDLSLTGTDATLSAHGVYDVESGALSGAVDAHHVDISVFRGAFRDLPFSGHASGELHGGRGEHGVAWEAHITPEPDLAFAGRPLVELRLDGEGDAHEARFEGAINPYARFSGTVALASPHTGMGRIEMEGVPVASVLAMAGSSLASEISGETGGVIEWSGPLDESEKLRASISLSPLRLAAGTQSMEAVRPARLRLEDGVVWLDDAELAGTEGRIQVSGKVPLDAQTGFDLDLRSKLDLGYLSGFVPALSSTGTLDVALRVEGTRDAPTLRGTAAIDGGRLRIIGFPLTADRIHFRARIEPTAIIAEEINAYVGGGECRAHGRVELDGIRPTGLRLDAHIAGASLTLPEGFRGRYSGDLSWEIKSNEAPVLRGDLELVRGTWRRDFDLDRVSFGGRSRTPLADVRPASEGLARTILDLKIHANDNVWCHNDLADVEGTADLALRGTIDKPLLTGRFETLEGGQMRFRRVRYEIDQARVVFPPGTRFNPEFDIGAVTHVGDYEVHIHIAGNIDRLDYELSSNPPLQEKEILALLLGGTTTPGDQVPLGQNQSSETAAGLVGGTIGGLVGSKLERLFGFEEIRIDPLILQGTSDPTARVTIGKRLAEKLFVKTSISLNSPEAPIYQVDYQLNRKLKFLLERSEIGSIGGDLRFATRFVSIRSKRKQQESAPSGPKVRKPITEIRFQGDSGETPEQLTRIASLKKGQDFSRRALADATERLGKYYAKHAYLSAFIQPTTKEPPGGGVVVVYTIERGPKVTIKIEGAGIYEKRVRETLDSLWLDSSFGDDLVSEAEGRILNLFRGEGFYGCYVRSLYEQQASAHRVVFKIDTGVKVRVEGVTIEGALSIPEDEIRKQVLTGGESLFRRETLKPDTLAADIDAIENLYRTRGFLQVSAKSEITLSMDGGRARVKVIVSEGAASRLRLVSIRGNSAIGDDAVKKRLLSRAGGPFLPVSVSYDLEAIRDLYDSEGYPEARIEDQIVTDGESVDLVFEIVEGERKVFRGIQIEGNDLTKESVIRREVHIESGEPISQSKLRAIEQRLTKTGLFRDVEAGYENDPRRAGGQVVRIKVREADNLVLGLGGGYDTESGPRGSVELADTNLWGYGRYASVSALYGSKLKRAQVTLKDPRLFQRPWTTVLSSIYEKRQRESFTQRKVEMSFLIQIKPRAVSPLSHFLRYTIGFSDVFDLRVPERTFREAEPRLDLGRLRLASIGYAIVGDTRDDPLNPVRGTYGSADIRVFTQAIGSEKRFSKLFLQANTYYPLPLKFSWSVGARVGIGARLGANDPVPLQERYFAGGDTTVRGFGRDQLGYVKTVIVGDAGGDGTIRFLAKSLGSLDSATLQPLGGEALMIINNELRRPVFKSLSAVAFWDVGNVFPQPRDFRLGLFRQTVGLGLRLETPVGPLRLEYGRKLGRQSSVGIVCPAGATPCLPRPLLVEDGRESAGEFVFSFGQSF